MIEIAIVLGATIIGGGVVSAAMMYTRLVREREERASRAEEKRRAGDIVIPCPQCSGTRAKASVVLLRQPARRGDSLHGFLEGDVLSCQECGHVFALDGTGTFRRHPAALPLVPIPSQNRVGDGGRDAGLDVPHTHRPSGEEPLRPLARPRPRT